MWCNAGAVLRRFFLLGLTSFGGPTAHIGIFHTTFVHTLGWITEEEFAHDVTLCQLIPGPASSQLGMLIGARRAGIIGSLCAWIGFTAPSAVLMYLAARNLGWIATQRDAGAGLLVGAAVTVCGAVWGMLMPIRTTPHAMVVCACSAGALCVAPHLATQLIVLVLSAAYGYLFFVSSTLPPDVRPALARPRHSVWLLGVAALLLGLSWAFPSTNSTLFQTGALVFGGGHVVLPLLLARFPDANNSILQGYAIAQLMPGPLFTLASFIGAWQSSTPLIGAIGGTIAIFAPGWLLVCGVQSVWSRFATRPSISRALKGTHAAVVGMLVASAMQLVYTHIFDHPTHIILALMCAVLLIRTSLPPWLIPLGCALVASLIRMH